MCKCNTLELNTTKVYIYRDLSVSSSQLRATMALHVVNKEHMSPPSMNVVLAVSMVHH